MKRCRALLRANLLGALFALLMSSATAAGSRPSASAQHLTEMLRNARSRHGLSAALCGVWKGDDEVLTIALGNSMTDVPATKNMHLRVGGVEFTCVAALLLRLVDQGKVSLDDTLSRWYPRLPQAKAITLRMLANCTSGYPDYVLSKSFVDTVNRDAFRDWSSQELIDIGLSKPLLYRPGAGWNYSHTNFVILGEVLQKVSGQPMRELMRREIFTPLGLRESDVPPTPEIAPPVLHAFSSDRGVFEDSTYWNPSWTSLSGRMTSTLHDLGAIARALGSGPLLSAKSRREMTAPKTVGLGRCRENLYYGMGIIMMNGWMAQNPRFGGYNAILATLPSRKLSIIIVTTQGPKSNSGVAYSTLIFKDLVKYLAPDAPIPAEFH